MLHSSGICDDVCRICTDDRTLLCSRCGNRRIYADSDSFYADSFSEIQQFTESGHDPDTSFFWIQRTDASSYWSRIYYFIRFVHAQSAALSDPDTEIAGKIKLLSDGLIQNWAMWITVIAFVVVVLLVNLLRTRSFDYAWRIAVIVGGVSYILVILAGDFCFDVTVSMIPMIISTAVSVLIGFVLEFFVFGGDYSRTERLEYEDDEYYYYVKAVPKAVVATSERSIKKINAEPIREEKKKDNTAVSYKTKTAQNKKEPLPEERTEILAQMPKDVFESKVNETPKEVDKIDFEKQLEESLKDL